MPSHPLQYILAMFGTQHYYNNIITTLSCHVMYTTICSHSNDPALIPSTKLMWNARYLALNFAKTTILALFSVVLECVRATSTMIEHHINFYVISSLFIKPGYIQFDVLTSPHCACQINTVTLSAGINHKPKHIIIQTYFMQVNACILDHPFLYSDTIIIPITLKPAIQINYNHDMT